MFTVMADQLWCSHLASVWEENLRDSFPLVSGLRDWGVKPSGSNIPFTLVIPCIWAQPQYQPRTQMERKRGHEGMEALRGNGDQTQGEDGISNENRVVFFFKYFSTWVLVFKSSFSPPPPSPSFLMLVFLQQLLRTNVSPSIVFLSLIYLSVFEVKVSYCPERLQTHHIAEDGLDPGLLILLITPLGIIRQQEHLKKIQGLPLSPWLDSRTCYTDRAPSQPPHRANKKGFLKNLFLKYQLIQSSKNRNF